MWGHQEWMHWWHVYICVTFFCVYLCIFTCIWHHYTDLTWNWDNVGVLRECDAYLYSYLYRLQIQYLHVCICICVSVCFFCISAFVSVSVFELVTVAYNQDDVGVEVARERHAGDAYLYLWHEFATGKSLYLNLWQISARAQFLQCKNCDKLWSARNFASEWKEENEGVSSVSLLSCQQDFTISQDSTSPPFSQKPPLHCQCHLYNGEMITMVDPLNWIQNNHGQRSAIAMSTM